MKPLGEMTFEELVTYCQASILLDIPKGEFNHGVWRACDLTLQWKQERGKYLNSIHMEESK